MSGALCESVDWCFRLWSVDTDSCCSGKFCSTVLSAEVSDNTKVSTESNDFVLHTMHDFYEPQLVGDKWVVLE